MAKTPEKPGALAGAARTPDHTRTITLAGRPLTFSTAVATREELCGDKEGHFPHPDDDGTDVLRGNLPEKWRGLLVPYNVAAPDGRVIQAPQGEPKSRQFPLPLNVQTLTSEGHDNAIPIGRVNRIWSQDGALWGEGEFDLLTPEGRDWAGRVARGMAGWGSVDLDAGKAPLVQSQGRDRVQKRTYPDWTFAGFTLVTRPAFDLARIGPWFDEDEMIDDEKGCLMPEDVQRLLDDVRDDDEEDDGAPAQGFSSGSCGCNGSAEDEATQTFPGGGKSGLPLGERGAEWDGPGAAKRLRAWAGVDGDTPDWAKYAQGFFWHAPDPSKLGDFKLPFADVVDGRLTAMPRGIFAAAAALGGSRGQTPDIPEADLPAVRSKISAYYRKMKMKAPWDSSAMTASAGSLVRLSDGIEGIVTGYDEESGWLRISCGPDRSIICEGEDLAPESLVAAGGVTIAAPMAPPDSWFENPQLTGPTGLTVDEDGRVFGHLATWGTCHTSFSDTCVTAPRSATSYGYFHVGEVVTESGKRVSVGKITTGGGHAAPHAGWRASAAHYDRTSTAAAIVRAGEDQFGIWVAGALVPEATPAQVASLRRSPLSGDWRRIAGSLELVAALAVNTPGFPIPRARAGFASTKQASLVAAGVVDRQQAAFRSDIVGLVETALENVLESYAQRRTRAEAAFARIAEVSACAGDCGCDCADEDDEE